MNQESITFKFDQFNRLFPFYILIDNQLKIQSIGKSLRKICDCDGKSSFSSLFLLKRPELGDLKYEELVSMLDQIIILQTKEIKPFILRGQFEYLVDKEQFLFVGSPWFDSVDEIKERNLTITDFAIHDPIIDLHNILMTQKIATSEIKELLSKVSHQRNILRGINEFSADLLRQITLDEIAWTIIESAIRRFDLEDCVIYLIDEDTQYLSQRAAYGYKQKDNREIINPLKIKIGDGIVGKVALTGEALLINDTSLVREYIPDDKFRYSELTVPIISDKKVIGIIDSEHSKKNFFTKEHLSDFTIIANLAAIKMKNAIALEKQAKIEKALIENRQRFEELIERAGETLYELNSKGYFTYANSVFSKMTGYTLKQLREKKYLELVKDSHREEAIAFYYSQLTQQLNETYFELPIITSEGITVWVGQNVTFDFAPDGRVNNIIAVARDITEKRLAEIALRRSEDKYRGIIANMELGIIEVGLDERIQYVNQSFCKMSGYSLDELLGKIASKVLLSEEGQDMMAEKHKLRDDGISYVYEIKIRNRKNERKWWLISGGPSYDSSGNMIGSIGIHLDITSHKKLEKELKKARQVAEDSSKAKEYFLANMSHEIRTPLNAILGMLRELLKSQLDEKENIYANNAKAAAEHLLSIVNKILDISKIEAGQFKLENQHFQLKKVFDSVAQIMSIKAIEKHLDLAIIVSDDIKPAYIGDAIRIRQILINLVDNALKFTEKGNVTLRCEVKSTNNYSQLVYITVSDTGIGIEDAYLSSLFKKFSQEDESTFRRYGGTGLGMAITSNLIQLMGGEINVSSKIGIGTQIDIELPLPIGNVNEITKGNIILDYTKLKGIRILLVEDNPLNRLVAVTTLSKYNVFITEVENGKEAIEKVKAETFDIILMDIQMPIMDGIQATRIIRNELEIQTPIIALTANAFKKQIDLCLSVGMNAYVVKPFEEKVFVQVLLNVIEKRTIEPQTHKNEIEYLSTKTKAYDLAFLEKSSGGDQEFLIKMIHLFIRTIPASIHAMKDAYKNKDFITLNTVAHRIKPSISDMGIREIVNEIKQIEMLALSDSDSTLLPQFINKVERVMGKVIDQLKNEVR
jgi:PAS domain S-box-containing protein